MTPLDKPLRRELRIGEDLYTLTISPDGLKLVSKCLPSPLSLEIGR